MSTTKRMILTFTAVLAASGPLACQVEAQQPPTPIGPRRVDFAQRVNAEIRIVGPDGRVHVQRFEGHSPLDFEKLNQKLQELREAAGDKEAVERINQELLELASQGREGTAVESPDPSRFGIGISLAPEVPAPLRAHLKLEEDEGVLVQAIAEDSPAAESGIREFDVVLTINDKTIDSHSVLVDAVQSAGEAEESVTLVVLSKGERKEVKVLPTASGEIEWPVEAVARLESLPGGSPGVYTLRGPAEIHRLAPGVTPHQRPEFQRLQIVPPMESQRQTEKRLQQMERQIRELHAQLKRLREAQSGNSAEDQ